VELAAQALALGAGSPERSTPAQVEAGVAAGLVGRAGADALLAAADLFWRVQAAGRLLAQGPLDGAEVGEGGRRLLLRETNEASADALLARMSATAATAADVIDRL
jgi:glutamate-ammonia-ligase adenylyltransferase